MRENKFSYRNMKYIAFGLSLFAFVFFILACTVKITGVVIFFSVMAVLSLIGGCVCLYLSHRSNVKHQNYFLFDRRRGVRLAPEEITFEFLNDNLTYYLSPFTEQTIDLWNGIPKELEMALQSEPAYRTPVAFKMLYDRSLLDETAILALFNTAEKKTVASICRAVKAGGDKEMADVIFEMKCDFERLENRIVPFFKKNKRFFEGRIFHYIKNHLAEFETTKKQEK